MDKHIRGGPAEPEAWEGLPVKDYMLRRLEERIVNHADRLVDIIYEGIVPIKSEWEAEDRFEEILRNDPKYRKNEIMLNRYLGYHQEVQRLMKQSSARIDIKRTIVPGELGVIDAWKHSGKVTQKEVQS